MEQSAPFETVTKLEVAERQLRVAIRMFFERRDMIAVHTLAAAALDILRQLSRPAGYKSVFDLVDDVVIPEKRTELRKIMRAAQNFFKHAGKDATDKFNFYFEATKFDLIDASRLLVLITGHHARETAAFTLWFLGKYPDSFQTSDIPELEGVKESMKLINLEDFELIISVMDTLKLPN